MSNPLFSGIRKVINGLGYEVVKIKASSNSFRMGAWLEQFNIKTIIDIGANVGQFSNSINATIPGRKIIAFEPIKECYDKLLVNTKGIDITAFNCGISDSNGTTEINVSENFVSSSILPIEDRTTTLYPDSKYVSKQTITLKRLDDVIGGLNLEKNILLKIDVQGYEENVVAGATETLKNISVIIIEFSYQPLYEGQWLFDETYRFFTSAGFTFAGIADQIVSADTGMPVYGDAIFIRK